MNASWGWNVDDTGTSPAASWSTLCETVGRGGNLLLNVGPTGDGSLPAEQQERLETIAEWMDSHAAAIHDAEPGVEPWQFYGPTTRRGRTLPPSADAALRHRHRAWGTHRAGGT